MRQLRRGLSRYRHGPARAMREQEFARAFFRQRESVYLDIFWRHIGIYLLTCLPRTEPHVLIAMGAKSTNDKRRTVLAISHADIYPRRFVASGRHSYALMHCVRRLRDFMVFEICGALSVCGIASIAASYMLRGSAEDLPSVGASVRYSD